MIVYFFTDYCHQLNTSGYILITQGRDLFACLQVIVTNSIPQTKNKEIMGSILDVVDISGIDRIILIVCLVLVINILNVVVIQTQ